MASSGSPLADKASKRLSASKNPSCPIVASANQNLTNQIRTGREKQLFFEVPIISFLIKPNEISLLGLYRDRLSRTFLFDPTSRDNHGAYRPIDTLLFNQLSTEMWPYHIINTAITSEKLKIH